MSPSMIWWALIALAWVAISIQATGQELLVSVGSHLEIGQGENVKLAKVDGAKYIAGVSNVAISNNETVVFVTDVGVSGAAVYRVSRTPNLQNTVRLINSDPNIPYYDGIVFDDHDNTILVTSPTSHSIFEQEIDSIKSRTVLVKEEGKKPSGITQERCSRDIYWTNRDRVHPSIERTLYHRSLTYSLFITNLTLPRAITTDPWQRSLYWTDQVGFDFRLEMSDLDGANRELICTIKYQTPYSLAVDRDTIYWSDWSNHAIWMLPKSGGCKPQLVRAVKSGKPNGLVIAMDQYPECGSSLHQNSVEKTTTKNHEAFVVTKSAIASTSVTTLVTKPTIALINETTAVTKSTIAPTPVITRITKSTNAPTVLTNVITKSQVPLCLNSGNYVAGFGCDCQEGYSGARCEVHACHNYCLNNAVCVIISEEPACECDNETTGDRCQYAILSNRAIEFVNDKTFLYIVGTAGGVCLLLIIAVIALTFMIIKMKKQPRLVRKRFISGSNNKMTKVAASGVDDGSGVFLDIENCCNMTLCDTPCFEPPSRAPKSGTKARKCNISEDKKQLLNSNNDELF